MKNIEKLFGDSEEPGMCVSEGIREIMIAALDEICSEGLEKATLQMNGGIKGTISRNVKGEIKIERKETKKQQLTE